MICSCRISPLRLFVRGMAQLHLSEPAAMSLPQRISKFQAAPKSYSFSTTAVASFKRSQAPKPKRRKNHDRRGPDRERQFKDANKEKPAKKKMSAYEAKVAAVRAEMNGEVVHASKTSRDEDSTSDESIAPKAAPAKPPKEPWQVQKAALQEKFPEGWMPMKRLSPDAVAGIRALHVQFPDEYSTPELARMFEVSPEAIRRILKSKWRASSEEEEARQERWYRRGVSVWSRYAEMGMKPPQKWRREGVARDPAYHESRKAAIERRMAEEEAAMEKEGNGARLQMKFGNSII
ncbi:Required for respiratory growth protein 9 [Colletotrichum orbiculare MAFF 240422]|uniref:Required for respiratory growth protein 9, mitochondrial n=1 Tax=Colletotrichum orbiculare (strain 104-T / ATCC 96160 / CBS 514.97 / LARS 414 / MAFF 240422) TaxID=1213857 RepID=A0A484FZI1_COLOR|nr:Required for respiratory growth protein 9 [Colletotrichum orbiculare MAFF 240422]